MLARDRRRRVAAADAGAGLGRPRHDRAPRRHRRDGDRRPRPAAPGSHQRRAPRAAASGEDVTYQRRAARPAPIRAPRCSRGGSDDRGRASDDVRERSIPTTRVPWGIGMRATVVRHARGSWRRGRTGSTCAPRSAPSRSTPIASRTWPGSRPARSPTPTRVAGSRAAGRRRCGSSSRCRRARRGRTGPPTPPNRITGPAGEYCRVFVQRLHAPTRATLRADGAGARRGARRRARLPVTVEPARSRNAMPLFSFEGLTPRVHPRRVRRADRDARR